MPALEAVRRGQMRERRVQRLERRAYQEGVERGDEGGNSAEGGAKWRECVARGGGGELAWWRELHHELGLPEWGAGTVM